MRYYATLDTNVLVSAMFNDESIPGKIVAEAMEGRIIPLYNNDIIEEYYDVLTRWKFRFNKSEVQLMIDTIFCVEFPLTQDLSKTCSPTPKMLFSMRLQWKK